MLNNKQNKKTQQQQKQQATFYLNNWIAAIGLVRVLVQFYAVILFLCRFYTNHLIPK